MCGPKQPNGYTRVLMLTISVLTQHYHITYRAGMASLYLIKCQLYTKSYSPTRSGTDSPQYTGELTEIVATHLSDTSSFLSWRAGCERHSPYFDFILVTSSRILLHVFQVQNSLQDKTVFSCNCGQQYFSVFGVDT